ncbi:MAG: deoxynucleoside kinase [Calditrichaeota bacterium]|nr:deoxynucleoside kinase [Calditrichota bacterium]
MDSNYFFAIAGNIGVGKTTWTQLLSERFSWRPYFEKVKENPYLENFYKDMRRWSFHSQIFFLTQRFKAHQEIQKTSTTCIQDRTIFEDAEIFARILHDRDNISDVDYQNYRDLYGAILNVLRFPDLIIYLKASTWTLLSRIRKRGREFEREIDKEYLAQLNIYYDKWVEEYSKKYRVLVVDTDDLDIEKDTSRLNDIIKQIGLYETQMELFPKMKQV